MASERREVVRTSPESFERTETLATPAGASGVYEPAPGAAVGQVQTTAYDPYAQRRWTVDRAIHAIYLVVGLVEALLVIRFLLRLFGANPQADFARFIYGTTAGLVAPFVGLFATPQADGGVLELYTIVAIVIYALVAWLIARLVWLLLGDTRSAVTTSATSVETRAR